MTRFLDRLTSPRTLAQRTVPALLTALVCGCSDDGATPQVTVTDAAVDAATDDGGANTGSGGTSTTTELSSPTNASESAPASDTGATSSTEATSTSSEDGSSTSSEAAVVTTDAVLDAAVTSEQTSSTVDVDASTPIDWTNPATGITCMDPDHCLNQVNALAPIGVGTAALTSDGRVWYWGGPLDIYDNELNPTPALVPGLTDVVAVSGSWLTLCAVKDDGSVWCWGISVAPMFGPESLWVEYPYADPAYQATAPAQIPGLDEVKAVGTGVAHACAIEEDGDVWCWGSNASAQLGATDLEVSTTPIRVAGLPPLRSIGSGAYYTCGISVAGDVYCWGSNRNGQLGDGEPVDPDAEPTPSNPVPQKVVGLERAIKLTTGLYGACATTEGGETKCWGYVGWIDPNETSMATPTVVPAWAGATDVSYSYGHGCAIFADGSVSCAGDNSLGQLGASDIATTGPVSPGIEDVKLVAVSGNHSCAVTADGQLSCWGDDMYGTLGDGALSTNEYVATPVRVASEAQFTAVAVGPTSCGLQTNGKLACWGANGNGELGVEPAVQTESYTPLEFSHLSNVTAVTSGDTFLCALLQDTTVSCWGDNTLGQLGNAEPFPWTSTPVAVTDLTGVDFVQAGADFACALLDGGTVSCWGNNQLGQLGQDWSLVGFSDTPMTVPDLTNVVQLSVGGEDVCAMHGDQSVTCWGANRHGILGEAIRTLPVDMPAFAGKTQIATGNSSICMLNPEGTVSCARGWRDYYGDAGVHSQLETIDGLSNVTKLTPECAIRNDGSLACWERGLPPSDGADGGLAPAFDEFPELGAVADFSSLAMSIACAVKASDSSIACWGYGSGGQLGDGVAPWSSTPTPVAWPN